MNAIKMAQRAYAPTTAPTRSNRSMEYDVIARITARLKRAIEGKDFTALIEALHENRTLWRRIAVNVVDPENELSQELRARLYYLNEFTHHYTSAVINERKSAQPLLDVNTAILRGLKQEGTMR